MMEPTSIQTGIRKQLSIADFAVFVVTLGVSLFIGLYFAVIDRKKTNPSVFLVGGRQMGVLPVSLSLSVTFLSALTLLGIPAEVYNYNTMFWWVILGLVFSVVFSAHLFNPFIYNLGVTSVYEYLDMRFGKLVTVIATLNWMFQTIVYISFVLYAPSLALKSVTGMGLWVSILSVGGLVTIYTSLGGMKAVLWTDSFQTLVILIGLLAVFIQGCVVIGGFPRAWEIANNDSRIYFHDFNPDPTRRHSVWSVVIGCAVTWMSGFSIHQSQIQRILCVPTLKKAQLALWLNLIVMISIMLFCCLIGVLISAFYSNCHPKYFNNLISSTDELVPLFVMDVLGHLKGLPGIFLSCVFSGSLSSLSSGLNALSAVTLQDYVRPFWPRPITAVTATVITKVTAALFGVLCIGLAFVASKLGHVFEMSLTVMSALDGPLFGLFLLGMFFPRVTRTGALFGYFSGLALLSWIGFGAYFNNISTPLSKINTDGCNWNVTNMTTPPQENTASRSSSALSIYHLSYLLYGITGAFVTVVVGYVVSLVVEYKRPITTDPRLILPVVDVLCPCLPSFIKQIFSYKAVNREAEEIDNCLDQAIHVEVSEGDTTLMRKMKTVT